MPFPSMSRRESLRLAALAAIGPLLGGRVLASERASAAADKTTNERALITKPIPSTGERIPVIGLGTNQYSVNTPEEMAQLRQVFETMLAQGGSVIDTARAYGRAEEVIGELFQAMGHRDKFFLVTKTAVSGSIPDPEAEIQASFDRLKVDVIDVLLIHQLNGLDALMPAFIKAKEAGRVRYIGMSTSDEAQYEAQMRAMRKYPLDVIQVNYSLANRAAADAIIPLAQERGIAVMANMPFGGRRNASGTFSRVSGKPLPDWAADIDASSWAQVFLKYVVSHPGVTVAIPGTIQTRHMIDNQGAGRGRLPDAALRREIERYWETL